MLFQFDIDKATRQGKVWVRCKTLSDKPDGGLKSGFVDSLGFSREERLAVMRFKGESAVTVVPIYNVYIKIKD